MTYMSGDFPCDATSEREKVYPGQGSPRGYLDGKEMSFDALYSEESMRKLVQERLTIASDLSISISVAKSQCTVNLNNTSSNAVSGSLHVILFENEIPVPTADWDKKIAHGVPRKGLNDAGGEAITIEAGKSLTKEYALSIDSQWKKENCRIVAFVQKSDKDIVQAAESSLQETAILHGSSGDSFNLFSQCYASNKLLTLRSSNTLSLEESRVEILDMRGRVIFSSDVSLGDQRIVQIPLGFIIGNGIYIVRVHSGDVIQQLPLRLVE